jgi:hypothetical protein
VGDHEAVRKHRYRYGGSEADYHADSGEADPDRDPNGHSDPGETYSVTDCNPYAHTYPYGHSDPDRYSQPVAQG